MAKLPIDRILKTLGRRVALERQKLNLTQEALAEKVGVQKRWISRVENGWVPGFKTLLLIAQALDLDPCEFFQPFKATPSKKGRPPKDV